jgi:uncharacterized protein
MPVSKELQDLLACPRCKGELRYPDGVEEIHCLACKLVYRIDDGIPVMLIEEARPLEEAG